MKGKDMTQPTLLFLHTSPVHVATFERLVAECVIDPASVALEHVVDESLLQEAREQGGVTPALRARIECYVEEGVEHGASVIVCTCSTIGASVEEYSDQVPVTVMRVDRAMAEEAVRQGECILLVAALESTLAPTRELLLDAARRAGKAIDIVELLCREAWAHFERGDQQAYLGEIATQLRAHAHEADVVVLSQASMAGVSDLCPDLGLPMLTSPRLGTLAALHAYQARQEQAASNREPEHDARREEAPQQ
ncbi:hypothetical protein KSC_095430 [Ktedonobacter sp. SOSP1-52]|nr:hypothetical protein KSC_095430 [Ktedonobacter sp. SOSP1-52]